MLPHHNSYMFLIASQFYKNHNFLTFRLDALFVILHCLALTRLAPFSIHLLLVASSLAKRNQQYNVFYFLILLIVNVLKYWLGLPCCGLKRS